MRAYPATPVRYSKQRLLCAYGTEAGFASRIGYYPVDAFVWGILLVDFESHDGI
jgi:hypothetical protein